MKFVNSFVSDEDIFLKKDFRTNKAQFKNIDDIYI